MSNNYLIVSVSKTAFNISLPNKSVNKLILAGGWF